MVVGQVGLLGLLLLPVGPALDLPWGVILLGRALTGSGVLLGLIAASGLGSSLTPTPVPRAGGTLKTGGLYRFVRHPIYSSLIIAAFGVVVSSGGLLQAVVFGALCVLLDAKAAFEERLLGRKFSDYAAYAEQRARFFPGIR